MQQAFLIRWMATLRHAALAFFLAVPAVAPARAGEPVDLQLVLAVDVSYSMDPEEQRLQRQGYAEALNAPEVLQAISKGMHRRIAVAYVEWAGAFDQTLLIDWRMIDGPAAARTFTDELLAKPYRRVFRTSISGGLLFSMPLFERSPYAGERQVIDVSGDGANNQGPLVTAAREQVLAKGITINGLPILVNPSVNSYMDVPDLDVYYEECVIGGDGAFMIPIRTHDDFLPATRRKILLEIANLMPEPRLIRTAAGAGTYCDVGERMWMDRNGGGGMPYRN